MPTDDYSTAISGGLKLKGVSAPSKVSKTQKKKRPKHDATKPIQETPNDNPTDAHPADAAERSIQKPSELGEAPLHVSEGMDAEESSLSRPMKTEAELRHEERKRKRVSLLSYGFIFHWMVHSSSAFVAR